MKTMECVICKNGTMSEGLVSYTLERGGTLILFRNVPAIVCNNCGNFYLSEQTTALLLDMATKAIGKGVEIEIINLHNAAA